MAKEPSDREAQLRALREARYGHLQATADPPPTDQGIAPWVKPRKPIPYAGKVTKGIAPEKPKKPAAYAGKPKRKKRKD